MDQLTAPPELTPEKMEELRGLLRAELLDGVADASPADEEDADMLLDYATDMIEGDENVGHVIEEVSREPSSSHRSAPVLPLHRSLRIPGIPSERGDY